MRQSDPAEARRGLMALVAACTIWGFAPLFYRLLLHVPTMDVLAHRILWSFVFFALVLWWRGRLFALAAAVTDRTQAGWVAVAALFISCNWFFYIFAVQTGHVSQSSLGYYISPLVSVLFGWLIFRERLLGLQWAAVAVAALAVALLTWGLGVAPWISLLLAFSFAVYGVVKKRLTIGPMVSVTAEVVMVLPLVLAWLVWRAGGEIADGWTFVLLLLSGPMTATPMILFSYAAQRVRMSTLGVVQYMNPTMQFLIAVLVFAEPFTFWHAVAFPMIWLALAVYSGAAVARDRAERRASTASGTVDTV